MFQRIAVKFIFVGAKYKIVVSRKNIYSAVRSNQEENQVDGCISHVVIMVV